MNLNEFERDHVDFWKWWCNSRWTIYRVDHALDEEILWDKNNTEILVMTTFGEKARSSRTTILL